MSVTLTDAAARHVTRYMSKRGKGVGVRLGVRTTGCSGLAYKIEYADEIAPEDVVFEDNGVKVRRQGAGAHAALMATTMHLGFQPHPRLAAHIQRAYALGTVSLVRSQAHQVHRQAGQIDVHTPGRLRGVHMENHAFFTAQGADGRDVLDDADLVIDKHHARQDGVGPYRRLQHLEVQQAIGLHVQISHFKTLALQFAAGVQHGLVFGLDRDEVLAAALVKMRRAFDRQVVGLGGAAGPDDLARVGAYQFGHLFTRLFDGGFRLPAPGVAA